MTNLPGFRFSLGLTSIGYVLVAIAGKVLLHEQIGGKRWAGIVLIMAGVALVSGGTVPQTAPEKSRSAEAAR